MVNNRLPGAAIVAMAMLASPAFSQGFTQFQSPTGNIHCMIFTDHPAEARCDIIEFNPSFRQPPRGCDLDWGSAFSVGPTGSGILACVGDTTIDPGAPVLDYGGSLRAGPFKCSSATNGVTCVNASGGGFHVSRSSQRIF